VLRKYYVNIVDLVDARNGDRVMDKGIFDSKSKLSKYTTESEKIYPLNEAKANALLKQFLIKAFHR